jgi:hypothetical protein
MVSGGGLKRSAVNLTATFQATQLRRHGQVARITKTGLSGHRPGLQV